nr:ribonuclease H-like domain-containing protein [Tanacetum cinerariifolium]
MRVESINGKKYILVIMDDYSRFTWVKFLRSKDETLDFIIKFLKMIQNLYKALVKAYDADKTILDTYGESAILKRRREEDDDQEGPFAGSDRGSKRRREGGEHASASTPSEQATGSAGRSTIGTQSRQLSASESAFAEEPMQTTCPMEEPSHPVFETGTEDQPLVQTFQHSEWFSQPRRPPTQDHNWNKSLPAAQGNAQSWISALEKQTNARSSFNELLDTPIDVSNFIINRLGVDTLTPKLLAGPTYELMRGSCNSLAELEYHLEEVYKATTDQLDWDNPEGQQCPHNLLQPLPLIPDNWGRCVISFEYFINNDLEYLRKEPINYDKHAFWGVSHWGWKHQQFYGFAVNRKSTLDVYSKRRIIAVTELKIMEWHNYKHLDWISLSNLTVEERFAFNVSLRMFTRSIVIQWRMEDLQLGVESYQKRLNLTKSDTYRSDLKRREAYTAYLNPRGFIYQNKDKKNRLMRIDELYKFSDGTLNDVRNAIDDRLKGIKMQYLPTTIWRKGDKDRAVAMIQAIDKMLKTRRIMRSLERFVGGRQYEGDFRMLQRTI